VEVNTVHDPLVVCFPALVVRRYMTLCVTQTYNVHSQGDFAGQDSIFQRYKGLASNRDVIRKLLPMEDEWEIPPVTIVTEKQLGEGCFGQVYKGFVRGPIPGSRIMKDCIHATVAVKYLKGSL